MNLFDYIKYQSIDLSNVEDIRSLPYKLIQMYWQRITWESSSNKSATLAEWYNANSKLPGFTQQCLKKRYRRALAQYCKEHYELI